MESVGWSVKPDICGSHDVVPSTMDRLKGLGNAVVPQIPYIIGQYILQADQT